MSKQDKKRVTITIQFGAWRKLKHIEETEELWGLSKAIDFVCDEYEKSQLINSEAKRDG